MPRLHALEALPDDDGVHAVRRCWSALRSAGLPSQLDHRGETNTPHLTLVSAPVLGAPDDATARALLSPVLPVEVGVSGLLALGHGPTVTLALVLDVPEALVRAVLDLGLRHQGAGHRGWLPHVTVARRLPQPRLAEAVAALTAAEGRSSVPPALRLISVRRWDPDAGATTQVLPPR